MKVFPIILILLVTQVVWSQSNLADHYINTYKDIAIDEMHRTGIPASIKLAQGLLESNWGRSELAVKSNNHFGIKCSKEWDGKKHFRYDDEYDDKGKKKKSCFRDYEQAEASFYDHSEFLTDPKKTKRYGFLFNLSPEDYEGWAHGLRKAGYATDPKYGHKLIQIIEKYDLHQYDLSVPDMEYASSDRSEDYSIQYVNSCKVLIAKGGENLRQISEIAGVSTRKLLKYNVQISGKKEALARGERVFLESRKNYYIGDQNKHHMRPGQDLAYISTLYGIDIEYLMDINDLDDEQSLAGITEIALSRQYDRPVSVRKKKEIKPESEQQLLVSNSEYLFEKALSPTQN